MALPDGFIDEIKARIRPSELIGRSVALKRQGREFAGLSPFKKERTPSFFVNDEKGFYHCFASQKHGDVISWLQEMEGLSFMEAVERLAAEAGLPMPAPDPEAGKREERKRDLSRWTEAAHAFFQRRLKSGQAAEARSYLERRGLGPQDWERFGIGYAPNDRRALRDALTAEGARIEELVEAGLLIKPDDGSESYDRFRDRIIFPIGDARGRVVAFGGRALSKEARAKYLNSPETPLFHKGATLYRYAEARKAAADPKRGARGLIVAEGYMDVIAFARAGLDQAVAPLGTALTEDQLRLLWRAGGEPVVCLDGDGAGRRAAASAAERALPLLEPGRTLRFVFLPEGADPDDLMREGGAQALRQAVGETRPLADVLWERERDLEPLDDPDRRAGLRRRLRGLVSKITDPDVREEYRAEFDRRLAALFQRPRGGLARRGGGAGRWREAGLDGPASAALKRARAARRASPRARHLLLAVLDWPELAETHAEMLAEMPFGPLDSLRDAVLDAVSSGEALRDGGLKAALADRGFSDEIATLDIERAPMRAALGGEDAAIAARAESWRALAASYMETVESDDRKEYERALTWQVLGADDSERMKRLVAEIRRTRKRR